MHAPLGHPVGASCSSATSFSNPPQFVTKSVKRGFTRMYNDEAQNTARPKMGDRAMWGGGIGAGRPRCSSGRCAHMDVRHLDHAIILLVATVVAVSGPQMALADPQGLPPGGVPGSLQENASDYNGEDITRPESKFDARFQGTDSGATTRTDKETLLVRLAGAINLDADWKFGWLAQIPVVQKNTAAPEAADASQEFGIGDGAFQGILSRPLNERWAYGFGARLVVPTAEESLGSGKWQIMPGFGVRYSFLEDGSDTYFVPKIRYALSFAGDPTRRNISEPQIAPTSTSVCRAAGS
jgi:hypothetical protein